VANKICFLLIKLITTKLCQRATAVLYQTLVLLIFKIMSSLLHKRKSNLMSHSHVASSSGQYKKRRAGPPKSRLVPGFTRTGGAYLRFTPRDQGGRGEMKYFDTALSFTIDTTGEVPATGQLVLIPQGVTETTRVGRLCRIRSIQMRGTVSFAPAAAANAATNLFVYLVLDTQTNGAAAAVTDVLTSNNLGVALINLNNSQRFRVIKRFKMTLNSQAGATTAYNNVVRTFDFYKRCNYLLDFSSTTGAITELRSNNLFLLAGSDGSSDDTATVAGNCRVRFTDS